MLKRFLDSYVSLNILLCISLCISPAFAASDPFQNAVALYNQKNFQACTPLLETYIRANPANKVAYCYLANSYYALGRYDQAKKIAEYVIVNFTMTPESAACGELIARLQAKTAAQPSAAKSASRNLLAGVDPSILKSVVSRAGSFDIDSFVYTVRGNLDTGEVSAEFLGKVKTLIKSLPEATMARLQRAGCKVCVTPRMADKLPGFAHERPRGWGEDMSGKHVDGLFNGEVIICEHSISYTDDFQYVRNARYEGVLRHEIGHAVDYFFGNLSDKEDFKHTYLLELARVDVDAKEKDIAYYAQKSDAGRSECFAELFAAQVGGGCSKNDAMLLGSFPNTAKFIKTNANLP